MPSEQNFDIVQWMNDGLSGFDRVMGFRILRATPDEVILEYEAGEQHHQPYGIVHGGVHSAAVETVCSIGAGLHTRIHGQGGVVGVENHTSFVRAVRTGRVRVTGKPLSRGRRSQVWEATARNEEGKIVSTGRVRLLCLEAGAELAGEKISSGSEQ
jgi:1,4-dihydroxy-2-naphthoyl-CoA hydrolase